METVANITDIGVCIIESFIILYVINACFSEEKIKITFNTVGFLVLHTLNSRYLENYFLIQAVIGCVLIVVLCCFQYKKKLWIGLVSCVIVEMVMGITSISIISFVSLILQNDISVILSYDSYYRIILVAIAKLLNFLVGYAVANFVGKIGRLKRYQWIYLIFYYFMIFFGVCAAGGIMINEAIEDNDKIIVDIVMMLMIVSNVVTLFLVKKMNNDNRVELENQLLSLQIDEQKKMVEKTKGLYEETRALRHDLKHYLTTIGEMLTMGRVDDVLAEIKEITEIKLTKVNVVNISNGYLNAAINAKLEECESKKIKTDILVSGEIPNSMSIDITIMIMNLLDNAVEAEMKYEENKRYIHLSIQRDGDDLMIQVANYIEESILKYNKKLISSKKDRNKHGIGLVSVRKTIEQYMGFLNIEEKNNKFVVTAMITVENFVNDKI